MGRLLFAVILVIVLHSCKSNTKPAAVSLNIDTLPVPQDSTTQYFSSSNYSQHDTVLNKGAVDSFANSWYSYHLYALKEPVLKNYRGNNEVYRFTWLRSFDHPITIRLQRQDDHIQLMAKMTSGAGGYEAGKIVWDTTFAISIDQWNHFITLANNAGFWQMPTNVYSGGKDGAQWIVEGVRNQQYHWVNRWSPVEGDAFRRTGEYLLRLSNVSTASQRVY